MTKFCPFMSVDPSTIDVTKQNGKMVPCMKNCALYQDGFCSINVLAQKAMHDGKMEKKSVSE